MFLIDFCFQQPLELVEPHVAAHRAHLAQHYESGALVLGGRKKPRSGGVILSRQATLAEVCAIFDADPMVVAGVARYSVIEFEPVMAAPELTTLLAA